MAQCCIETHTEMGYERCKNKASITVIWNDGKENVCSKCFEENRDVYEDFKDSRKPIYVKEEGN
jgi:hypothetical protein